MCWKIDMEPARKIEIRVANSTLTIVPAVHFRLAFAEEINAICRNPATRPDAVAVELGPSTAIAVTDWLKELGIGPQRRQMLPCMLGYVKQNRYLRPSLRDRAMHLQLQTGRELAELPSEVLDLELGFRATSLVPLSPTDSIIEALRCACELDVPAYGVDLEDTASLRHSNTLLPDPVRASGRVADYAGDNMVLAAHDSDPEVNGRREYAMAARLKTLLTKHDRVLFTCGLAHWRRVIGLIEDPQIRRAEIDETSGKNLRSTEMSRVVVHPAIAVQFMDRFPSVARFSERWRRHPLRDPLIGPERKVLVDDLYEAKMRQAVRRYIRTYTQCERLGGVETIDLNVLRDFPAVVREYCLLKLQEAPDISATHSCGRAFLGDAFAKTVLDSFMNFPWVSEHDFPGCSRLSPANASWPNRICISGPSGDENPIAMRTQPGGTETVGRPPFEWAWDKEPGDKWEKREGYGYTWDAWGDLVTALSDNAIQRDSFKEINMPVPFEGTMQHGLATKATIRAMARGEDTIYVLDKQAQRDAEPSEFFEGWPVVWIFDDKGIEASEWHTYVVPLHWLEKFAKQPAYFMERYGNQYRNLTAILGLGGSEKQAPPDMQQAGVSSLLLRGLTVFSPVFPSNRQYTRWVERTTCRHNPLFTTSNLRGLPPPLAQNSVRTLGHVPGEQRWQDEMVAMALPFAGSRLTVVAPQGFRTHSAVQETARKLGKEITIVRLESFAPDEIDRIKKIHSVLGTHDENDGRTQYAASANNVIGESRDQYRDRVPAKWRSFGRDG